MPSSEKNPRAVILTALPVEYQAVRTHVANLHRITHKDSIYEQGIFSVGERIWDVMIVETDAGNMSAAVAAERVISYFEPEIVLFVGVAGGLKDVELGDVVAATKVYGYESGKANTTFLIRPDVGNSSFRMVELAKAEGREKDWLHRIKGTLPKKDPKVYVRPIAAGEKVVDSIRSETFTFLTQHYGDAVAVEMEGRGFLQAVYQNRQVDALIIRGISDLIEEKSKTDADKWQETAVQNASAFAFEILTKIALEELEQKNQIVLSEQNVESSEAQQSQEATKQQDVTEKTLRQPEISQPDSQENNLGVLKQYCVKVQEEKLLFISGRLIFPDQCKRTIELMENLDQFFQSNGKSVHHDNYALRKNMRDSRHQISILKSVLNDLRQMPTGGQTSKKYQVTLDTIRSQFEVLVKLLEHLLPVE